MINSIKIGLLLLFYILNTEQTSSQVLDIKIIKGFVTDNNYSNLDGLELRYLLQLEKNNNLGFSLGFNQSSPNIPDSSISTRSIRSTRLALSFEKVNRLNDDFNISVGPELSYLRTELHESVKASNPNFKRFGLGISLSFIYQIAHSRTSIFFGGHPGYQITVGPEAEGFPKIVGGTFRYSFLFAGLRFKIKSG